MKFKLLAAVLAIIPLVWAAWWWLAAGSQKQAIEDWLAAQRARGWQAEAAEIAVAGFPNRLDARLDRPAFANVEEGWSWRAQFLDVLQVIYDPTFMVVVFPPEAEVAAPGARARLTADRMRASLRVADAGTMALERLSAEIDLAGLASEAGWTASVEKASAHVLAAPDAGPENAYRFRIEAAGLRLPDFLQRLADPAGALPKIVEAVTVDGRAAFSEPLDRTAFEVAAPPLDVLSIASARAVWGKLDFAMKGSVSADAAGYAEGEFDISATNWREMIEALVAAGAMPASLADTLKQGLGFVARLGGDPDTLNVALAFSGGFTRIGPVPVGPAPRMRFR